MAVNGAGHLKRSVIGVIAAIACMAMPAQAQYSAGYKFLEAIKKIDGEAVMEALNSPGTTIINSRDITTGETALHLVVQRRDTVWVRYLLQQGANPNIGDAKGITPLVLATQIGFVEGAEILIAGKAKVDIANNAGETPLISAVHQHDIALIRVLLKAGADPDRSDNSGRSARDYAELEGAKGQLLAEIDKNAKPVGQREGAAVYGPSF